MDVGSVVTTSGDDVSALVILVVESSSWDMLGVTSHSSTWLSVLENWELVDGDGSKVITGNQELSVLTCINSIDIGTVSSLWEDTSDFPTELTGRCLPKSWVGE